MEKWRWVNPVTPTLTIADSFKESKKLGHRHVGNANGVLSGVKIYTFAKISNVNLVTSCFFKGMNSTIAVDRHRALGVTPIEANGEHLKCYLIGNPGVREKIDRHCTRLCTQKLRCGSQALANEMFMMFQDTPPAECMRSDLKWNHVNHTTFETYTGISLDMRPANERHRYNATSLIG